MASPRPTSEEKYPVKASDANLSALVRSDGWKYNAEADGAVGEPDFFSFSSAIANRVS